MLALALYLLLFYFNVTSNGVFMTTDLYNDKNSDWFDSTVSQDKQNSTLVQKINDTHINSSYRNDGKMNNKTLINRLWINNLISDDKENSSTLVTTWPKTDFIQTKSSKVNYSTESKNNLFSSSDFTEFLNSINQSVAYTKSQNSDKKLENETLILMTDKPVDITLPENYYYDHKLKPDTKFSHVDVSTSIYMKDIISSTDNETGGITSYEPSYSTGNTSEEKNELEILTRTESNYIISDSTKFTKRMLPLLFPLNENVSSTEEPSSSKFLDYEDLLNRKNTTESLVDFDQYVKRKNKESERNSSTKSNNNLLLHSSFKDINQSVLHTNSSNSVKQLQNGTLILMTDKPVNITKAESYYDLEVISHTEFSPVDVSTSIDMKIVTPATDNKTNNLTVYEVQPSDSAGNINEEQYESEILKTTGTTNLTTILETLSQRHATTQSFVFFNDLNTTDGYKTTELIRVHSPLETRRINKTLEFTTESTVPSINNMKPTKYPKEDTTNVSKNSSTNIVEFLYSHSNLLETTTDPIKNIFNKLPEPKKSSNTSQTFDTMNFDNKIPSNHTDAQTTLGHVTETTELINATVVNDTQCKSNQCIDQHGLPNLLYKNYTFTQTVTDKWSTLENDKKTEPATGYKSTTSEGRTDQRSKKTFSMVPWKSLTNGNLQDHCITVTFQTTLSNDIWLSSYDIKFRRFISHILNKMKAKSNIVYVSPTPISISGELLVAFIIETHVDSKEIYEPGLNISQQLHRLQERFQTQMDIKINKIQLGFPEILKKDSYYKTNKECVSSSISWRYIVLTVCITIIIVIFLATGIHLAMHWPWTTAHVTSGQHNSEDSSNLTVLLDNPQILSVQSIPIITADNRQFVITDPEEFPHYRAQPGTNKEAYALKLISKPGVNNYPQQEKMSSSHNSVCTLGEE